MVRYIPSIGGGFDSKVKIYLSTNTSIPPNTYTVVPFNRIFFDVLGEFDTVNYRFIAKESGYYQVNLKIMVQSTASNYSFIVRLLKSGVDYSAAIKTIVESNIPICICDIVYLDANDYVNVMVWQNSTSNQTIVGGFPYYTNLSIHRLS
jgi:hypothetical protein